MREAPQHHIGWVAEAAMQRAGGQQPEPALEYLLAQEEVLQQLHGASSKRERDDLNDRLAFMREVDPATHKAAMLLRRQAVAAQFRFVPEQR